MAIVNNGTRVSLQAVQLPTGYTLPTVTEIADYDYISDLTLNVLKSTVENATDATTLTNILGDAAIGITKQITDILAADYLATATVTAYADLTGINHNIVAVNTTNFYDNTAVSYVCTVRLYVKAA